MGNGPQSRPGAVCGALLNRHLPRSITRQMQERGVEPLHLTVQAPKTCASANSATPASFHLMYGCFGPSESENAIRHDNLYGVKLR